MKNRKTTSTLLDDLVFSVEYFDPDEEAQKTIKEFIQNHQHTATDKPQRHQKKSSTGKGHHHQSLKR